jgi:hypothetical protein
LDPEDVAEPSRKSALSGRSDRSAASVASKATNETDGTIGANSDDVHLGGVRGLSKPISIEDVLNGYAPGRELTGALIIFAPCNGQLAVAYHTARKPRSCQTLYNLLESSGACRGALFPTTAPASNPLFQSYGVICFRVGAVRCSSCVVLFGAWAVFEHRVPTAHKHTFGNRVCVSPSSIQA